MTVKIYGSMRSRARRVVWCCKELGIDHEIVEVGGPALKEPAFLAVNPNGKVPAIQDGDVRMFESLAINLYLAKRYGSGKLYPSTPQGEALTFQWTLWAQSEVETACAPLLGALFGANVPQEAQEGAKAKLKSVLGVLDAALKGREYLVEDKFTVCDMNVAACVVSANMCKVDISYAPNVQAWMGRCLSRPSMPQ